MTEIEEWMKDIGCVHIIHEYSENPKFNIINVIKQHHDTNTFGNFAYNNNGIIYEWLDFKKTTINYTEYDLIPLAFLFNRNDWIKSKRKDKINNLIRNDRI